MYGTLGFSHELLCAPRTTFALRRSFKSRFWVTATGKFKRMKKGKRHKSFSKSPDQRRTLRQSALVHKTLERPMKKLNFKLG